MRDAFIAALEVVEARAALLLALEPEDDELEEPDELVVPPASVVSGIISSNNNIPHIFKVFILIYSTTDFFSTLASNSPSLSKMIYGCLKM